MAQYAPRPWSSGAGAPPEVSSPTQVKSRTARRSPAVAAETPVDPRQSEVQRPSDHDLLEWMPDGVVVSDTEGRIVYATGRVEQMTGYTPQELQGHAIELLVPERLRAVHGRHRRGHYAAHAGPRPMGGPERDFRVRRKDGSEFSADIALGPVRTPSGPQTVAVIRDITERKRMEVAIEHRALHDPLTDLANRTLFLDRLSQSLLSARREGKQVALVILDLDGFKEVNDSYGHVVGDELLRELAGLLRAGLRATDTAARIGGDEFAWVLPNVAGRRAAERMVRKRLKSLQVTFSIDNECIEVRVSAGVALYPDDGRDVDTLMRFADSAMYSAKRAGRGTTLGRGNHAC
ncbi:MAG TPA: diguanylate cyclase [Candidatus Dormibacteraeota bacterium]|nr:diguanylate cyclase [Candidatus Dormibacteraeota bacterium]